MRLRTLVVLTAVILLVWLGSWAAGLPVTQGLAALLVVPYAALTAYTAWARVRVRAR